MEKVVGTIMSKTLIIIYHVKWNSDNGSVWISEKRTGPWFLIAEKVRFQSDALDAAQSSIDSQPKLF